MGYGHQICTAGSHLTLKNLFISRYGEATIINFGAVERTPLGGTPQFLLAFILHGHVTLTNLHISRYA